MAIEKHMLQTHSLFEKAVEVFDGVAKLKERIAELEEERRWRKCSAELPPTDGSYMCAYKNKNKDDGVLFVDEAVWDGEKWSSKFDFWEDIIYWQFKPKAPEVM